MNQTFREVVIGGILVSPFVGYLIGALLLFLLLRPALARVGFENHFSSPPLALFSLFVLILALLIVLF